jgi:cytochrome c oxidase accessory protein FixG
MSSKTGTTSKTQLVTIAGTEYHRKRKLVHLVCFGIFLLLPLSNLMRFDIPRARFYFFGAVLLPSEFAIIFFSLIFLMFVIVVMAMLYGRMYCSYLCPQMIFSEAAAEFQTNVTRKVNKHFSSLGAGARKFVTGAIFYGVLLVVSVLLSFVFICYFVEPADLFHRLMHFDVHTAGGIAGASTTLFTMLDFAFVRQRFCTSICPYGYLQGMLADRNTLLVRFDEQAEKCINCKKCERVCPMGIDIRNGSHQIECTHCGECIDACSEILGRLGRQPLIHYSWGDSGELQGRERTWLRRLGLRDGKRFVVLGLVVVYGCFLFATIHMRQPVMLRVIADRSDLYTITPGGQVHNRFRLMASNRGAKTVTLRLSVAGLAGGHVEGLEGGLTLKPGESVQQMFDVAAPQAGLEAGVNHCRILASAGAGQKEDEFPVTFITPMDGSK